MKNMLENVKFRAIIAFLIVFSMLISIDVPQLNAAEAKVTASLSVDRKNAKFTYNVKGLDLATNNYFDLTITDSSKKTALEKKVDLTSENVIDGEYKSDDISLEDLGNSFDTYKVSIKINETEIVVGSVDFTIHTEKVTMAMKGGKGSASRTVNMTSTEAATDVIAPGANNKVSVYAWPASETENNARAVGTEQDLANALTWKIDLNTGDHVYGNWNAKLVLKNSDKKVSQTLATATFVVSPTQKSMKISKKAAYEKKQSFRINLSKLKNAFGIKKVSFRIYNAQGSKVATLTAKKNAAGTLYYKDVTMKKLGYKLGRYKIKAVLTDAYGSIRTLATTVWADQNKKVGAISITKKAKTGKTEFKLSNAYLPGYIKKVKFFIYKVKGSKNTKVDILTAKGKKKNVTYKVVGKNESVGKYLVKAYAYTQWNKKVFMTSQTYKLSKKDMGKNGWIYEKYRGKKYKFYYVNNEKQTDLTKVLKLKKSDSTNTNNFYIEVNRAACTVTIYMKNSDTGKYDIPVKTCTVSIGRDTSTVAGTGGLNQNTSYTPIGTYSICSNGESVKYSLKTMHEPDGSICYARWASHIVGNVYFHAVAVGAQSHYALSSYQYNRLGSPASAGCVRMTVADAKWIYDYASAGSTVKIVKGNKSKPGPLGKNKTIKINGVSYDPTDPAVPLKRKKADYKAGRISGYMTKSGVKVGY